MTMTNCILVLTLASWAACFWVGYQIGMDLSEQKRRLEVAELERRFKIMDREAVETADVKWNAHFRRSIDL